MIEKKDYENAIKQFENIIVNTEMHLIGLNATLEEYKKELAALPEEEEEKMPEELKEIVKEAAS